MTIIAASMTLLSLFGIFPRVVVLPKLELLSIGKITYASIQIESFTLTSGLLLASLVLFLIAIRMK